MQIYIFPSLNTFYKFVYTGVVFVEVGSLCVVVEASVEVVVFCFSSNLGG